MPRPGQVLGLVGANGTGKSTALKILAGKLKPNLGDFEVRQTTTMMTTRLLFDRLARRLFSLARTNRNGPTF